MTTFQVLVLMMSFATLVVSILALSYTFSQKK